MLLTCLSWYKPCSLTTRKLAGITKRCFLVRRFCQGQPDNKLCPVALDAGDGDIASMGFNDFFADVQPQPHSTERRAVRPVDLIKAREEVRLRSGRDARAI